MKPHNGTTKQKPPTPDPLAVIFDPEMEAKARAYLDALDSFRDKCDGADLRSTMRRLEVVCRLELAMCDRAAVRLVDLRRTVTRG